MIQIFSKWKIKESKFSNGSNILLVDKKKIILLPDQIFKDALAIAMPPFMVTFMVRLSQMKPLMYAS